MSASYCTGGILQLLRGSSILVDGGIPACNVLNFHKAVIKSNNIFDEMLVPWLHDPMEKAMN